MGTLREIITVFLLAILAMMTSNEVHLDGTARGVAFGGLRLDLGGRRLALAFVEYRPARVYWRARVGVGA